MYIVIFSLYLSLFACFPPQLIDEWNFDVFALSDASAGSPLRYLGIDLMNRYGVIHKFKVRIPCSLNEDNPLKNTQ